MPDQVAHNKRGAAELAGAFAVAMAVVLGAVLFGVGLGFVGLVGAVVLAAIATVVAQRSGEDLALRLNRAVPADPRRYVRLHNLVDGLCIANGLAKPRIFVVEDAALNAFAVGRSPQHASLAVTTGLLDALNRIELEGVLAHELSHIKNGDILGSTLAVPTVGWLAGLPVVGRLQQVAVRGRREERADVSAVEMTNYPPGLIAALGKLRDDATVPARSSRATAHLWIASALAAPTTGGEAPPDRRADDTRPPLDERIAALLEL